MKIKKITQEQSTSIFFNTLEQQLKFLEEPKIDFSNNKFPISAISEFKDSVWNWSDKQNIRLTSPYTTSRISIDWDQLKLNHNFTNEIIEDLKIYSFLRNKMSHCIFLQNRKIKNAHPATIVNEIKAICLFIAYIKKQLTRGEISLINKLSDIRCEDLEQSVIDYSGGQRALIKQVLCNLASPSLQTYLKHGEVNWNKADIENLPWKVKNKEHYKRLPDALFRLLSNSATQDIKQFLLALEEEVEDVSIINSDSENIYTKVSSNFKAFVQEYIFFCQKLRNEGRSKNTSQYVMWCHKKNGDVKKLASLITRARTAAQLIIAMYTGARLSELASLKIENCLQRDEDGWFLLGTVIKNQQLDAQTEEDKWVAIPIVRDAVKLLVETSKITGSPFLFHPSKVKKSYHVNPRSVFFSSWFGRYLSLIDSKKEWSNEVLHLHRFRHSLAYQMRKAGLSLPFITYQLKHVAEAYDRSINKTSIMYGAIDSEAASNAINEANLEYIRQIYDPNAPLSGGGAEELKQRRKAFFEGMAIEQKEEILFNLAKQGMPLTDVGLGLCQGQKNIIIDGIKQSPPCIGSLRCNPVRCKNGIIPKFKVRAWERVAEENKKRLMDQRMSHATEYYKEALDEAESVIDFLKSH